MRKLAITIALLLSLTTFAMADEPVQLWEQTYISEIGNETEYVSFTDFRTGYGIATLDGTVVIPQQYGDINFASLDYQGYFTVANENITNNLSLIDINNNKLTSRMYGDIKMISENWFVGVVLTKTTGDDYDYSSWFSDNRYIVDYYDIYHLPTGKIGSLQRGEYKSAKAFGDYLLVADLNGAVQLYNRSLTPVSSQFTRSYDCEYYIAQNTKDVFSRITGQKIASGYVSVDSLNGDLFAVRDQQYCYGIIDRQGKLILDTDYASVSYSSMTGMIEIKKDGYVGLFDPNTKKIVLPCEYDSIIAPDHYNINNRGYYMVEKASKVGYVNANNQITCPLSYSKAAMTLVGCTMYAADLDGTYKLVAADGTITPLPGVTEISKYYNSPDGYYLVIKNQAGLWGIMDWHGNLIVDYCAQYDGDFDFVDATHFIYDSKSMYQIK